MRVFSNGVASLLFLVFIFVRTVAASGGSSSAAPSDDTSRINLNVNNNDLEDEVMHETIATGRGHRDEAGQRDEWSSKDHLVESIRRVDTRKGQPVSSRVKQKLQLYRLDCHGCDNHQAVAKINAFILDTQREAKQQAHRQSILSAVVTLLLGVAVCAVVYFFTYCYDISPTNISKVVAAYMYTWGGNNGEANNANRRLQIEEQRRRAAAAQQQGDLPHQRANACHAPTWVDNERMEVWSPKQEKQFASAVMIYGRMSLKTRYHLIAENVDEKTKQECLMHHKLQQLIAKEQ
jgi:hypothetical protein